MIDKKAGKMLCLIVFFAGILIISSACSLTKNKSLTGENDWEDEVLIARDCGMDGLRCCPGQDPSCQFGQACCVSPVDPGRDQCLDDCACGIEKGFCCAGDAPCREGLACAAGTCQQCGRAGEPCCAGAAACRNGLVCHNSVCAECGLPGNPCCQADGPVQDGQPVAACRGQGRTDASRAECLNGLCINCGSEGRVACPNEPACGPSNLLNNGFCHQCGRLHTPCCDIASSVPACDPAAGLVCQLGFCAEEGAKIIE